MNKHNWLATIGVLTLLFFWGGLLTVRAQTPRRYYDWSATLDTSSTVLGLQIFAQETPASASASPSPTPATYTQFNRYVFAGSLLPGNPFYFVKTFQESLQLALTTDPEAKEKMRLAIAGEKLAEMQEMTETKNQRVADAADSYEKMMVRAAEDLKRLDAKSQEVKDLFKQMETETAKHNIILERVAIQVPDQAKDAIKLALAASWKNTDTVADIEGRPAVPPDLVDRIQALKAQGLLTEEEAAKLIGAKKREDARKEIEKYVKEGIVPEADFLRFNENVKNLYPDEFFKLHELKRFYELKNLEASKPDEATLARIQEFAKTYKSGDIVPEDIRKFWVPVIRLEELQNTLRPDLIDETLIRTNTADYRKFTEVLEVFKPRPEDIAYLRNFIDTNKADVKSLPPEYQRMYNLGVKYGAQCGEGQRWVSQPQTGGFCIKEGVDIRAFDLSRVEEFTRGKTCIGTIVSARGPGEACSAYPSDCIPPGWTKTATCIETPEPVGDRNSVNPLKTNCPSNAHYVPFIDACVPNYTPTGEARTEGGFAESACPAAYHRNYPGGPCLPDYNPAGTSFTIMTVTAYSLPPLTQTPGSYPSPIYTSGNQQCPAGNHWVPEPINPSGGYCAPDNYSYTTTGGGVPPGPYPSFGPPPSGVPYPSPVSGGGTTSSCQPPSGGCPGGWWDYSSCACRPSGVYPSSCAYPPAGCGTDKYWDYATCSCKSSAGTSSGTGATSTSGTGVAPPPSGYGSCPADQHWEGSVCVPNSTTSNTGSGGTSTSTSGTTTTTSPPPDTQTQSSPPPPQEQPPTTQTQPSTQEAPPPPSDSGTSSSTSCPSGQFWNGSTCMSGSQ